MRYDYKAKKALAVLSSSLETGIAMNVLGHMSIALAAHGPADEMMGRTTLTDASGATHSGIGRYAVIITKVKQGRLRRFIEEARKESHLFLVDFPQEMLDTHHDNDLAEAMAAKAEPDMAYLGAMVFGDSSTIQKLAGNFTLWK